MATPARHILLVNPNTNAQTTSEMAALARPVLTAAGFDLRAVNVTSGPPLLRTPELLAASVPHVLARVAETRTPQTAAVIVAAIGDPGVDELREILDIPVIGIGEASIRAANGLGVPFGMITTTPQLGPGLLGLLERYAEPGAFTGLRFTRSAASDLALDRTRQVAELEEAARECVQADGAQAVIVGGGPLGDAARQLAQRTASTFVEPLPSAAARTLAELSAVTAQVDRS